MSDILIEPIDIERSGIYFDFIDMSDQTLAEIPYNRDQRNDLKFDSSINNSSIFFLNGIAFAPIVQDNVCYLKDVRAYVDNSILRNVGLIQYDFSVLSNMQILYLTDLTISGNTITLPASIANKSIIMCLHGRLFFEHVYTKVFDPDTDSFDLVYSQSINRGSNTAISLNYQQIRFWIMHSCISVT